MLVTLSPGPAQIPYFPRVRQEAPELPFYPQQPPRLELPPDSPACGGGGRHEHSPWP